MEEHRQEGQDGGEEAFGAERREERSDDRSAAPDACARETGEPRPASRLSELGEAEEWDGTEPGDEVGDAVSVDDAAADTAVGRPRLGPAPSTRKGRRLVKPEERRTTAFTPGQRLLLLDTWKRSGLPANDFAALVGATKATLFSWRQRFERFGPEGLMDRPRGGPRGSRLPEVTRRTILMLKESHPEYGCQRISDLLARGPALGASPGAVATVLKEEGYELEEVPTRRHEEPVRRFERASPNQLWQTDLFTFVLKRQNRRVYLVAFMDDHSRFVVGYSLYASPSTVLVIETLRVGIANYGPPQEVLTDNGPQYVTWRGTSAFRKELDKQGIKHIVAHPKRPQTMGKVERFWGSLWRECLEKSIFLNVEDARLRVGLYIDHYNFHRPHQGIDGLVPADRFFNAAPEVLKTLRARVADNALELAQQGVPRPPLYLTGQLGGKSFAVHAAGERVYLSKEGEGPQEIDLGTAEAAARVEPLPESVTPTVRPSETWEPGSEEPAPPGVSVLDELSDGGKAPDGGESR
jgi:transposase InsO family protein